MNAIPNGLQFYDGGPPLNNADLDALEERIGSTLPPEYRTFLLAQNGGHPSKDCFPLGEYGLEALNRFLEVGDGSAANEFVNLERQRAVFAKYAPDNMLPIADDPGGNFLFIVLTGEMAGSIYFWDHEVGGDTLEEFAAALTPVADSFGALLAMLGEPDEKVENRRAELWANLRDGDAGSVSRILSGMRFPNEREAFAMGVARQATDAGNSSLVEAVLPWVRAPLILIRAAVLAGRAEMIAFFLGRFPDFPIDSRLEPFGFTLLHEVAATDHVAVAQLLLAHGADINAVAIKNTTPLRRARALGLDKMIEFLTAKGAKA